MMARQTVNLGKLAEAQEAADAVMEAATLAVERLANAVRVSTDPAERVTTTFRLKAEHYEYLRRAALEAHTSQQALLDEALELLRSRGRPVDD
jgi:hypothetical protein